MSENRIVFVDEVCVPGRVVGIEAKPERPFDGNRLIVDGEIAEHFRILGLLIDGEAQPGLAQMIAGMDASFFTETEDGVCRDLDRCHHAAMLLVRNVSAEPKPFRGKLVGVDAEGEEPDAEERPDPIVAHLLHHTTELTETMLKSVSLQIETLMKGNAWLTKTNDWLVKRYEKSSLLAMVVIDFAHELIGDDAVKRDRLRQLTAKYLDESSERP